MSGCIVGWSHSKFGKHEDDDLESLIAKVAVQAVEDAGLEPQDIGEIVLGNVNEGFSQQAFPASLVLQADDCLRYTPATRVENACATGTAALHQGLKSLRARDSRFVLCVGVEKMTALPGCDIGKVLLKASYVKDEANIEGGFAGVFGKIAELYFQTYGDRSDALALIAAKNHKNGSVNPLAQMQKDLGYDFCRNPSDKNPYVAGPLKRTDCSLVSDGAAAIVLTDMETALKMPKAVAFRAAQHVQDYLPMARRDILQFEGCARAWQQAHAQAGTSLKDLSLVETHDCFTIAELIQYEAMGLAKPGQGAQVIEDGITGKTGTLPVNASGGLKSKGHPIGATGISMHIMASMQLLGQAGEMQVADPKLAGVFNMGGTAVANYASILEPLRG
ncbi:MAG: acetyl-CoA acetyltransferase [Rhodospirillales bacterium]|nr:acetyl-CoA acetyltransferase [Rhodospirillales bacterium]